MSNPSPLSLLRRAISNLIDLLRNDPHGLWREGKLALHNGETVHHLNRLAEAAGLAKWPHQIASEQPMLDMTGAVLDQSLIISNPDPNEVSRVIVTMTHSWTMPPVYINTAIRAAQHLEFWLARCDAPAVLPAKGSGKKKTPKPRNAVPEMLLMFLQQDRRIANLSQKELAEILKCDPGSISRAFTNKQYGQQIISVYEHLKIDPPTIGNM